MPTKQTILIIEDDLTIARILEDYLKSENFNILTAHEGADGLKTAITSHPDLILLDILMPKMNGITMLEKLRSDEWGKNAKVIVLTNLSSPDSEHEAAVYMCVDYIIKADLCLSELVKKIRKTLSKINRNNTQCQD